MQTDRELLEAAAKAAGISVEWNRWCVGHRAINGCAFSLGGTLGYWNPLTDDGDALRLAVKLRLHLGLESHAANAWQPGSRWAGVSIPDGSDPYAATRRAIVRAAAALGEGHHPMTTPEALPPLPKIGPICYASASDILQYKPAPEVGTHLPGVRDVALWSTDQLRAYAEAAIALERECAAKVCEGLAMLTTTDYAEISARECAAAIRKGASHD